MTGFLGRPSASGSRWVARILGTLLGLILFAELIEWLTGTRPPATLRDYLAAVGLLLIISGFVVGWFKELAASLFVLSGTALVSVIRFLPPGGEWPWPLFIMTTILGFLFLYAHLARKSLQKNIDESAD